MKNIYLALIPIIIISCIHKKQEINTLKETIIIQPEERDTLPKEVVGIDSSDYAKIKFDYYESDAGDVITGPDIKFEFPFTNVGEIPFVITSCKSSCGCLLPICKDRLVLPGESGVVGARHLTNGRVGKTKKTITVRGNTLPEWTLLRVEANIVAVGK